MEHQHSNKKRISERSISINAPAELIWEALIQPKWAKEYFHGAEIKSTWKVGSSITFTGEYNGNQYVEKGIILEVNPLTKLQYSHWSSFDGLPDEPENYRIWTFELSKDSSQVLLSVSENNIPSEKQKIRSDEFWTEVLVKIKQLVEDMSLKKV